MKTITANGVELLLLEVPEDSKDIHIDYPVMELAYFCDDGHEVLAADLDYGKDYTILGTITNGVVDFDCINLVEFEPRTSSYGRTATEWDEYDKRLAKSKFLSLLAANGITGKKIVCLKISKA